MKKIVIVATLDTKGLETEFLKSCIERNGCETIIIDAGLLGDPLIVPDYTKHQVAEIVGTTIKELCINKDRSISNPIMAKGATEIVLELIKSERIAGIISIGGSQGTAIGTYVMRHLPIGFPKVMLSTMASGDVRHYVDVYDICMINSVVDISGLNYISKKIISNAAGTICGMVKHEIDFNPESKKTIAISMYGSTTPCVTKAAEILRKNDFETIIFHASGTGGRAMENLIAKGFIDGVLDITIGEISNEYLGGILSAGKNRLTAAAQRGIPQIVVPGGACTCCFGPRETIPKHYMNRRIIIHNPNTTLIRANKEEAKEIGRIIANKLKMHRGKNMFIVPSQAFCYYYEEGRPFYDPESDSSLLNEVKTNLSGTTIYQEYEFKINDPKFAEILARNMILLMKNECENDAVL